jgi:hypothetical protein
VITDALLDRFSGAVVIGEEAVAENPALLDGWSKTEGRFSWSIRSTGPSISPRAWPLSVSCWLSWKPAKPSQGSYTIRFARTGSWPKRAVVPILRRLDGRETALQVAEPAGAVNRMIGSASWQYMPEPERSTVARNQALCLGSVAYRCAAQEYRLLAGGHIHFALYNKLMPWDHLAGSLITSEAGGYIRRFDGSVYRPEHTDGGVLATTDIDSWNMVREALWRV